MGKIGGVLVAIIGLFIILGAQPSRDLPLAVFGLAVLIIGIGTLNALLLEEICEHLNPKVDIFLEDTSHQVGFEDVVNALSSLEDTIKQRIH